MGSNDLHMHCSVTLRVLLQLSSRYYSSYHQVIHHRTEYTYKSVCSNPKIEYLGIAERLMAAQTP